MNERPNSAIVPIVSSTDQGTFGTGFVIHQDREFSYLVTCAHVVCDIERKNEAAKILAGGVVAQVKGRREPEEIDLAVLAVPRWQDRSPLTLARGAESEMSICVWGHCSREDKSALVLEQQQGKLAKAAELVGRRSGEAVTAWYLQFEGSDRPEPGYSGGPVLCGDRVVAVAAIRMADNRVIAIGIEALARVWPEMPPNLIDTLATGGLDSVELVGREALPSVPVWKGRDQLVAELEPLLRAGGQLRVLALLGQGGIGKSALAVKLLEAAGVRTASGRLSEEFARRGFSRAIAFKAFEGTSFGEAAEFLLIGLGVDYGRSLTKPADKLAAIVKALGEKPALILLDNLEVLLHPAGHPQAGRAIEPNWGELLAVLANGNHRSLVLLTSREEPVDLAGTSYAAAKPNQCLVRSELLPDVGIDGAVEILRGNKMKDSEADLRWIADRVPGHPFVLELLARNYADCPGYLRQHPELLNNQLDVDLLIRQQLNRQSLAAKDLLQRMALLRVPIDARGLTYLRLYTDDQEKDPRFGLEEPAEFTPQEISATAELLEQLRRASLVQRRYNLKRCENFFDLHRVVVEFLQRELGEAKGSILQLVYRFYRTVKIPENPKTLEDLQPLLEAQYFAYQLGNYTEAKNLIYQLEDYLEPWGHYLDRASQPYILRRIGSRYRDWGNWDAAEKLYRQCLELRTELGDRRGMATSWGLLGNIERNRGNWDAAEKLYRQCLEVETELGDRRGMATSWALLGSIEHNRGNWDAAEKLYRQCLELRTELGDRRGMATSWGLLGSIEHNRGNWDAAEKLYRQCLEVETELGDRRGMATSWGLLGSIEHNRGNWDAAEKLYRQCLEVETELGDRRGMATSWGLLGNIERNRGNWDAAEKLYRQCLEVETELGDRSGMAESWGLLGDIERNRGNWDAAEKLYRQSLELITELGDRRGMATSWGLLGIIERNRGNWDAAEKLYRQCLEVETELGDRRGMATSWGLLGDIERNRGNWDAAEKLYRQSLELITELGDRRGMATSWGALGNIEHNRGNWDAAEKLYRQSLELRTELGDRRGMAESWGLLGDIERNRGNWDAAEKLYRQCLEVETELGDRRGMAESWGLLGDIEHNRGNWDAAEKLYRQCLEVETELGDRSGMATSWALLGNIERNRGNWDAAEKLYRQCLEVETELGDRRGMATSWGLLGIIERNRGNWDAAEKLYRQCLEVETELGDRRGMAESWGLLGDIEHNRGNWDAAEKLYRQCLEVETELGDPYGIAGAKCDFGELELDRNNLDLAESYFNEALQGFTQLKAPKEIADCEFGLARLWQKRGDPARAKSHCDRARDLYQQLGAIKDLERIAAECSH